MRATAHGNGTLRETERDGRIRENVRGIHCREIMCDRACEKARRELPRKCIAAGYVIPRVSSRNHVTFISAERRQLSSATHPTRSIDIDREGRALAIFRDNSRDGRAGRARARFNLHCQLEIIVIRCGERRGEWRGNLLNATYIPFAIGRGRMINNAGPIRYTPRYKRNTCANRETRRGDGGGMRCGGNAGGREPRCEQGISDSESPAFPTYPSARKTNAGPLSTPRSSPSPRPLRCHGFRRDRSLSLSRVCRRQRRHRRSRRGQEGARQSVATFGLKVPSLPLNFTSRPKLRTRTVGEE